MDYIVGKFITLPLLILEIFTIMMVYGFPRIISDIEFMLPFVKLRKTFWKICWVGTFPILICLLVGFLSSTEGPEYKDKSIPFSTSGYGWLLVAVALFQVPLWAMIQMFKN